MTELTITLPDDLARWVREAGLLNPEGIERALRQRRTQRKREKDRRRKAVVVIEHNVIGMDAAPILKKCPLKLHFHSPRTGSPPP